MNVSKETPQKQPPPPTRLKHFSYPKSLSEVEETGEFQIVVVL